MALKMDGWDGSDTEAAQQAQLWLTETVAAGDWIAVHEGDTTNPGGLEGDSFRLADSDEETYDVVGVAVNASTGAGLYPVYIRGKVSANVATGTASGVLLQIDATTPGQAELYAGTDPALRVLGTTRAAEA
jgi:hypothetical protein